jgi:hypothetical protein
MSRRLNAAAAGGTGAVSITGAGRWALLHLGQVNITRNRNALTLGLQRFSISDQQYVTTQLRPGGVGSAEKTAS